MDEPSSWIKKMCVVVVQCVSCVLDGDRVLWGGEGRSVKINSKKCLVKCVRDYWITS